MTETIAGLILVLKQDGIKLDNVVLTTSSFCIVMRIILFTNRVFISQEGLGPRIN